MTGERESTSRRRGAVSRELPDPELARSLVAALLQNASDLAADARVLLENGRFARAYALAVLSVEELGKTYLCLQVALGDRTLTAREFWTRWRDHGEKLDSAWAYHTAFIASLDDVDLDQLTEVPVGMGATKMGALYVDLIDDTVQSPRRIGPDQARQMLAIATDSVAHAERHLGSFSADVLVMLRQHAPALEEVLDRLVDETDPTATLAALRQLMAAGQRDDLGSLAEIVEHVLAADRGQ